MRCLRPSSLVLLSLTISLSISIASSLAGLSSARAETPDVATFVGRRLAFLKGPASDLRARVKGVAVGVNNPIGWYRGSLGGSLQIGVSAHHAVRASFARYSDPLLMKLLTLGLGPSQSGPTTDAGVSWVWYPRGLWRGPMLEVGALWRERDLRIHREMKGNEFIASSTISGRATAGWSWMIAGPVYVSLAVGISAGYERGSFRFEPRSSQGMTMHDLSRRKVEPEGYLRLGLAFGG